MATYYVDHDTGLDSNNGTSTATPWAHDPESVDAASVSAGTTLAPNDTVIFKGGVTNPTNHNCYDAGTAGNIITRKSGHLVGWGSGMAVIDGDAYANEIWDVKTGAHYLKFEGLEVKNFGNYGFAIEYSNGVVITGCKVHTRGASGSGNSECIFYVGCTGGEISYNEVYDSKWNAINVQSSTNIKIKYNYVHGPNVHGGINVMSDTVTYFGMMDGNDIIGNLVLKMGSVGCYYSRYQRNCIVANNVFDTSDQIVEYAAYISYGGTGGPASYDATGYKFFNNTLIGGKWSFCNESALNISVKNNIMLNPDGTYFVNVYAGITGNVFDYNSYYRVSGTPYWQWLGGGAVNFATWKSSSSQDANARYADPGIVNYPAGQYGLLEGGDAVNRGVDLSGSGGLAYDINLGVRPYGAAWDIGAYEYRTSLGGPSVGSFIGRKLVMRRRR